ncbi:amino acid adenylation domain-containing protein [Prauserella aidingensis]|uniref:non-ribosomal peptide synthetase n=1 Tax=Prauserella aidingensis TaxID=387890 RepID=UPI0020A3BE64|nr:non-ribosomal peptide synthetase [Prauserella aidingensis]MCP2251336.1 amino acid adenylation domain-containing protein [Prauserella aidingensis]
MTVPFEPVGDNGNTPADRRELLARVLADLGAVVDPPADIAIIGVAGRFPLAEDVQSFWSNLRAGRDCVREVSPGRWRADEHFDPAGSAGRSYSKWAGFLDDVDAFDPLLFRISPGDAEDMDPQERLFLETAWTAVENAGYPPRGLAAADPVGVFAGVMNNDYEWMGGEAAARGVHSHARSNHWSVSNRVSYTLDLHGPSMTVDTACSSSLTAIHLAMQSLRSGDSAVAIAGGVNLILHPAHLWHLSDRQMISRGSCNRTFGADADGFVDGEGVGAVVLKPLRTAVEDGDRVLGVLRGSALNAGGHTSGYTVPNPDSQAEVVATALRRAGVRADEVGYVEAHGTGTPLGDPIEIAGLRRVFGGLPEGTVPLGSVKSTIGHLESAAGIAALAKVLAQFGDDTIASSPHAEPLNPEIDLRGTPFRVPAEAEPWPARVVHGVRKPRIAGISSFGGGGANAHLVVSEYLPEVDDRLPADPAPQLVTVSARTGERLRVLAGRLADFLAGPAGQPAVPTWQEGRREAAQAVADVLGVDPDDIDPDVDLRDYGVGPTEWTRLTARTNGRFGLPPELPPGTSVAELARHSARATSAQPAPGPELADVAHTLRSGRTAMASRLALVVPDVAALRDALRAVAEGRTPACIHVTGEAEGSRAESGADVADAVGAAPTAADLPALARLWARGADVDWSRMPVTPGSRPPRRIALPTYPFERKRFWIPTPTPAAPGAVEETAPLGRYAPRWRPAGPVGPAPEPTGSVLVLAPPEAAQLAEAVAAAAPGASVVWLDGRGSAVERPSGVDTVVHLGGVRQPGPAPSASELDRGACSVFALLTEVRPRSLRLVTSDVHSVGDTDVEAGGGGNPIGAAVHGLSQVVAAEFAGVAVSCVDVSVADPLADQAAAVLAAPAHDRGRAVVVRGGRSYTRTLERVTGGDGMAYRDGGVYVIVGGTGGIGRRLTRQLVERHGATVVWLSRRVPDTSEAAEIEELCARGGTVVHERVDVTDAPSVRNTMADIRSRFGVVHGVFHAAMTFDDRQIEQLSGAEFREALAVKVDGVLALDEALSGHRPDFLALFSSAGSFGSSSGNSAYTTASACLDALGRYLDGVRDHPVRVINWGYWGAVGSGARQGLPEIFRALGIGALTPGEGLGTLPDVLTGAEPQVMVIRAEPAALGALFDEPATGALAAVTGRVNTMPSDRDGTGRVLAAYAELEPVVLRGIVGVLSSMGAFARGDTMSETEMADELGVAFAHRRQFTALVQLLATAGHLVRDGDTLRSSPSFAETVRSWGAARVDGELGRLSETYPEVASTILPVRRFLASYAEVLRGEVGATEILFPGASLELAVGFYEGNPVTDHYNDVMRDVVLERLRAREGDPLSVVELGAGTGATTERVLPALDGEAARVRYVYTDVSPRFLEHGRSRFGGRSHVDFRILDLRGDAADQGFAPASHDVVLATNVVHATPDLLATLRSIRGLLRPGGWLVLNELTTVRPSVTVAGGVLDGWWSFQDAEHRIADAPLAEPGTWTRLLREAGFDEVVSLGTGADLGQTVLVAAAGAGAVGPAGSAGAAPHARAGTPTGSDGVGDVDAELRDLVERALKLDERIDASRPLADYGFDSLTGMQVVNEIAERYGAELRLVDVLEHPTLTALSAYLARTGVTSAPAGEESGVSQSPAPPATAEPDPGAPSAGPEWYPMSEGQRALWIVEQTAPGNAAYNLPIAVWLDPATDLEAVRTALEDLVARHPALRTTYGSASDGTPMQCVHPSMPMEFEVGRMSEADAGRLSERLRGSVRKPFDLATGPLLRAGVWTVPDGRHALLITVHHGLFDGTSIAVLLDEFADAYAATTGRSRRPRGRPAAEYRDFVDWQRSMLDGPRGARLREFWQANVVDAEPLRIATDRPRAEVPSLDGASTEHVLDAALLDRAKHCAAAAGVSVFTVLLTAYLVTLERHGTQRRLTVGTPVAGRPESRFADTIGYFVNLVPVTVECREDDTFAELLARTRSAALDAVEHGDYPYLRIAEAAGGPIVTTAFYFQNWLDTGSGDSPVRGLVGGVHQEGEFELTADVVELESGCTLTMKYDPALFDRSTVDAIAERFHVALDACASEPDRELAELDVRTEAERAAIAGEHAGARRDYPRERTVVDLVADRADRHPDRAAVVSGEHVLTYGALVSRVGDLASCLTERGIGRGDRVGILVERSTDLVVSLLGVLAAGAAYVPLDPGYPAERLRYMATDAALAAVVSGDPAAAPPVDVPVVHVAARAATSAPATSPRPEPGDEAYVIYTSGSTGRPKGVRVGHRALVNLLWSMADEPGFGEHDRMLAITTVSFDIAALELFVPLVTGGSVEVAPTPATRDGFALRRAVETGAPTVMQATPATWRMLIAAGWDGDDRIRVFTGGEALDEETAGALLSRSSEVWNLYGPTETTIWSSVARVHAGEPVRLGRPVANTVIHLLDDEGRPAPAGVPAELCIGGDGLAAGYVGQPDLTRQRFVPNPVDPATSPRLYRTGDLARRTADGSIEYLGRRDSQLKIRGHRVEPGEIEEVARRLPGVADAAVVLARIGTTGEALRCFYTRDEGGPAPDRGAFADVVPDYMVPDELIELEALPTTLNGKIDRAGLSSHRGRRSEVPTPRTGADALSGEVGAIVADLLGLDGEDVDPDDRFGALGVDSVRLTELSARIRENWGVEIAPPAFFRHPTARAVAAHLIDTRPDVCAVADTARAPEYAPAEPPNPGAIAVVGMAGVLPGSSDLDSFWEHLVAGDDLVTETPVERWDWRELGARHGRHVGRVARWGGYLDDVAGFDAAFFGVSPREAELMDPQQRLVLETVWNALEDAALRPSDLAGKRVGVFLGVSAVEYAECQRGAGRAVEGHAATGAAQSIVANRVSYFFDFRGPSVTMDTACSSSLTAVAQAAASLRTGACDLAIAGGVNLLLSPEVYLAMADGHVLSETGRCRTFDGAADGYVRGEGAGVVVLRDLASAERAGDVIHAVVEGVATGHGGLSSSLTAPNPDAQADLLVRAYRDAGLRAVDVDYLEAHGTGTELGDPVEVSGMTAAFEELGARHGAGRPETPWCGVGSVKSNIGHLETAAGIAGLFKVILAMRHGMIPGNLHFSTQNTYLELDGGPFRVVAEHAAWPRDAARRRVAGVSSFGVGGSNAHVVVAESPQLAGDGADAPGPLAFPLSARTGTALSRRAGSLARFLEGPGADAALSDVAHTLATGREELAERAVIVASTRYELITELTALAEGRDTGRVVRGTAAKRNRRRPTTDEGGAGTAEDLAQRWVRGEPVALTSGVRGRRIALPVYPFEHTRFWVEADPAEECPTGSAPVGTAGAPQSSTAPRAVPPGLPSALHPTLLDRNVSTLDGIAFEKYLTGDEFYLADHVVAGDAVLPGVIPIELARLAGEHAGVGDVRAIAGLGWGRPVRPGPDGARLQVRLEPAVGDHVPFRIVTCESDGDVEHAAGSLVRGERTAPEDLDIGAIRARCVTVRTRDECYERVSALGFEYGPSLRAIEEIRHSEGEALATLVLPESRTADLATYVFEPALLDGALQTVGWIVDAAAAGDTGGRPAPYLPFSIDEVRSFGPLPERCFVHVSRVRAARSVQVFDVTLTGTDGTVVCRLAGFALKSTAGEADSVPAEGPVHAFVPVRRAVPERPAPPPGTVVFVGGARPELCAAAAPARVVEHRAGAPMEDLVAGLADAPAPVVFVQHAVTDGDLEDAVDDGFHAARELAAAWIAGGNGPARWLYSYDLDGPHAELHGAMAGFARSLRWEYPELAMRVVGYRGDAVRLLPAELVDDGPLDVHITPEGRSASSWRRIALPAAGFTPAGGGVHLVTGGTGALGRGLAAWIGEHDPEATVVLAARSEPEEGTLAALRRTGVDVRFVQADIGTRDGVRTAVAWAREAGRLVGVAHLAGTLRDGFLLRKTRAEADEVLRPKVLGAAWLDHFTRRDELDYFVTYSSTAAAYGNVGQADHATASAFLDGLARRRAARAEEGERSGVSLSVEWPLWADGGVTADSQVVEAMTTRFGLLPIHSGPAMAALGRALGSGAAEILLAPGDPDRIVASAGGEHADPGSAPGQAGPAAEAEPPVRPAVSSGPSDGGDLAERAERFLAGLLAEQLKMPADDLDPEEELDGYGVDSLIVMSATAQLEQHFGALSKTLFFEYLTLRELAGYFAAHHTAALTELLDGAAHSDSADGAVAVSGRTEGSAARSDRNEPVADPADAVDAEPPAAEQEHPPRRKTVAVAQHSADTTASVTVPVPGAAIDDSGGAADDPIAIIGVAGRYPQADDLWEFWENLRDGRDCVEDVPPERWDHGRWYDPEPGTAGKTATRTGGFLRDVAAFDPMFFRISPVEARHLDPQERIFLETVWHLLEDAGRTRAELASGRTGVFVGLMYGHYQLYGVDAALHRGGIATSSSYAAVANRVSYFYGLTGPSIALDTMCSSSLASIHLACQAIRTGDCDVAIAGGVNITSHPVKYLQLSRSGFLSESGACHSFGEDGDGFVPADGSGAVLLKRLSQAEADGDRVLAVVRGSAVNHGGASKGYSVPNPKAQGELVADALTRAGVDPCDVDYIEAHGTGTSLGDPIEISGLSRAFGGPASAGRAVGTVRSDRTIPIGSVKSNIGHAESAAGIAAVTKVLLQFRERTLAPSLHSERLNPDIDFAATPFRVQREAAPWIARTGVDGRELPRIAGISSFGAGGSNAHLILEEGVSPHRAEPDRTGPFLAVLSGTTADRMHANVERLADFLEGPGRETDPARLAFTLQAGREHLKHRLAVEFADVADLARELRAHLTGGGSAVTGVADRSAARGSVPDRWVDGATVDWRASWGPVPPLPVSLPGYAFERDRCWLPEAAADLAGTRVPAELGETGDARSEVTIPGGTAPVGPAAESGRPRTGFREETAVSMATGYVAGHRVDGRALMPALGYVELVQSVFGARGHGPGSLRLTDLTVVRPLVVTDVAPVRLTVDAETGHGTGWTVTVADPDGPYATVHVDHDDGGPSATLDIARARETAVRRTSLSDVYDADAASGQSYTGAARASGEIWDGPGVLVVELTAPAGAEDHAFDPALLLAGAVAPGGLLSDGPASFLPFHVAEFRAHGSLPTRCYARIDTSAIRRADGLITLDIGFHDEQGTAVAELTGLSSKLLDDGREPTPHHGTAVGVSAPSAAETLVQRVLAQRLQRDPGELDVRAGYFDLGIESVKVLDLVAAVEELVGEKQDPTLLFEHATIRALTAHLEPRYPQVFAAAAVTDGQGTAADAVAAAVTGDGAPGTGGSSPGPEDADRWVARNTLSRLRDLGLFASGAEPRDGLAVRHGVVTKYQRWLDEVLRLCEDAGFVGGGDPVELRDAGRAALAAESEPDWARLREALAADDYWHAQLALVEDCIAALPEVLTGKRPVTEILFPGGSLDRMTGAYQGNDVADGLNRTVAETVAAFVSAGDRPMRVAEIGAGTGGTTAVVLPALDAVGGPDEYWFTDLSPAFLSKAEDRFGPGRDYLRYGRWDVERADAGTQLGDGGRFDVLIASNVLHATKDLRRVVANLAEALRPGGLLVVNEVTRKSALLTLTFGLLDGWWLYDDARLRIPGAPLLTADGWHRLLAEHGFGEISRPDAHDGAFAEVITATAHTRTAPRVRLLAEQWEPAVPGQQECEPGEVLVVTGDGGAATARRLAETMPGATVVRTERLRRQEEAEPRTAETARTVVDLTGLDATGTALELWWPWVQRACATAERIIGVTRADSHDRHASRVAGLYGMLGHEVRRVETTHLDLEPTAPEEAAERILTELCAAAPSSRVRVNGGVRTVPTLRREEPPAAGSPPTFADEETLVVTGGTRGVGLAAARHAVTAWGVRSLVLIGRDELPPRAEWPRRARVDDPLGRKLRGLLDLAATGVRLRVEAVDLDDAASEDRLLELFRECGPIAGVLHAAGVVDEQTLSFARKTAAGVRRVLAPKTDGAEILLRAVAGQPVRFAVLFSSVASVLPALAVGQSDYAMANTHLDRLACAPRPFPVVSVQWPSWDGLGMGAAGTGPAYTAAGLAPLEVAEGLGVLDRVAAGGTAPVVVPVVPADERPLSQLGVPSVPERPAPAPTRPDAAGPARTGHGGAVDGAAAESAAAAWLLDLIAEQLDFDRDRLDADTPVQDYGTDSITLVELTRAAGGELGVELDPSVLIEHPTAAGFAAWLATAHPETVAERFGDAGAAPATAPAVAVPLRTPAGAEVTVPAEPGPRPGAGGVDVGARPDDLAVIGLSCRFPGAAGPEEYWRLLAEGRSAIAPVPPGRWPGEESGFHAGLVSEADRRFDPGYFGIADTDAAAMDPQGLLLLEETLFAWNDAGYRPDELKGKEIGVYVGGRTARLPARDSVLESRNPVVLGQNYLAANVSQHFDLRGPSIVVDTACSSALVALNIAAQALRSGELEAAVVGGVTLIEGAAAHQVFQQRGLLTAEPEFHAFDRRAGGFVPAEGAGVVIVKPLAAARADGDRILSVVKGIAVNNDGRTAGPATPNLVTQQSVLSRALAASGHEPDDVGYVEANASGSQVVDLIELKSVRSVYRADSDEPCALGSVKPNIGHPQCAEGIAGLIKVTMMLERGTRVPYLSGQEPPEHADLETSPFRFDREQTPWHGPRVAAINSFGDGGTNAHVVLAAWAGSGGTRSPLPRPELNRRPIRSTGLPLGPAPECGADPGGQAVATTTAPTVEPVAVIGMSGRYPGAADLRTFWANLLDGVDSVTEVPADRWDPRRFENVRSATGRPVSSWGGFVEDVDAFDASFFRISAGEAAVLDPQERLFLETCWEAIEDAGHTPETLCPPDGASGRRRGGVFAGVMHKDYPLLGADNAARGGAPVPIGLSQGQVANRVSFFCDFHGPSLTVDTLCSSSLTAVHLAVQSLRAGECSVAIAGGVNLSLHPAKYVSYGLVNMHATDGRCRSFGDGGDGYVSADGVGAVVLKPLSAAERDGDHVYAVVSGTAVGHGGAAGGFSVPNPAAQAAVLTDALRDAGAEPGSIGVLEAHGTGTSLGDPVEVRALTDAFGSDVPAGSCSLGSVKSNIGHAEGAAGISGLTKAILQLRHRTLVPTLHSDRANPLLELDGTPFRLQHEVAHWASENGTPRRAGVSSFGATGSNVHVIVEEHAHERIPVANGGPVVVPLSARTTDALRESADRLRERMSGGTTDPVGEVSRILAEVLGTDAAAIDPLRPWHEYGIVAGDLARIAKSLAMLSRTGQAPRLTAADTTAGVAATLPRDGAVPQLSDVAYTLQHGRPQHAQRAAFVVSGAEELVRRLDAFLGDVRIRVHGEDADLRPVAERWVGGATVPWPTIPGARRTSLPTYPFERERYWFTDHAGEPAIEPGNGTSGSVAQEKLSVRNASGDEAVVPTESARGLLRTPVWTEREAPVTPMSQSAAVVVLDSGAPLLADAVASRHRRDGADVVRLTTGTASGPGVVSVHDGDPFRGVLAGIPAVDTVHLVVGAEDRHARSDADVQLLAVRLVRALSAVARGDRIALHVTTHDTHGLDGTAANARGAGLTGLAYFVAAQEPRFAVRNVDVSTVEDDHDRVATALLAEPASPVAEPTLLRGGRRYRQRFDGVEPPAGLPALRDGGNYLIVGGAGVVGRAITRHLHRHYRARVAWTGRRPADDAGVRAAVEAATVDGVGPVYVGADVTDAAQLRTGIDEAKAALGDLNGVVFAGAATITEQARSLTEVDEAEFRRHYDVKANGVVQIAAAVAAEPLDFLCLLSSAQAFAFGGAGTHPAYAAGITFADAFARTISAMAPFPVGVLNWGAWESSFGTAAADHPGVGFLSDDEGAACFDAAVRLLTAGGPAQTIGLKPGGGAGPRPESPTQQVPPEPTSTTPGAEGSVGAGAGGAAPDRDREPAVAVDRDRIRALVVRRLARVLHVPEDGLSSREAFAELGVDSITGMSFVSELGEELGLELDAAILYDHTTIDKLTDHLADLVGNSTGGQR